MERVTIPGLLVLADGTVFRGASIGGSGHATGEVVFNTSMTGYQEIASDPSYAGQIVAMTSPHIGNYGTAAADEQSHRPHCSGFVTRSIARYPSNWRSEGSFGSWLHERGVMALTEVDTRRLTRHIRAYGAMPGIIATEGTTKELQEAAAAVPLIEGLDLASRVTTDCAYVVAPQSKKVARIVAIDLGIKTRIIRELIARGLETVVVPAWTSTAEILDLKPDGIFLSNGPGDPEPLVGVVRTLQDLLGKVPVFGICLGHQVLGIALGATTFKLPFGHHGGNHPVRRLEDGRVHITAQNHNFAVSLGISIMDPLEGNYGVVEPTHINLNDGTLEGLNCRAIDAFSVQYHPEAAPGPNDAKQLFDRFAARLGRESN
jgi:carbamoyl-phosphate synthase small subunit